MDLISKKIQIRLIIVALIFAFILFLWAAFHLFQVKRTEQIVNYLVSEKGYNVSDIADIRTGGFAKASPVTTTVIFHDELNAMYFYRVDDGKVSQYGQAPAIYDFKQEYIHSEHKY